jgi:hypothetical protein
LGDDPVVADQRLKQPRHLRDLGVQGFGGQEEDREVRGRRHVDVLVADVPGAAVDPVLEGLGCGLGTLDVARLGRLDQPLEVLDRKLAVDRQVDRSGRGVRSGAT